MPPTVVESVIPVSTDVPTERELAQRSSPKRYKVPSLDGLRAFSILLVIIDHGLVAGQHLHSGSLAKRILFAVCGNGRFGVQVFFVISGFLITTLFLDEWSSRGEINLKAFYIRRFFRILPAYFAMVGIVAALALAGDISATPKDFAYALTFTWIYNFNPWNWYLAHTWSLCVEQQFYLFWPLALVVLGKRRVRWFAVALIMLVPLGRLGLTLTSSTALSRACFFLKAGQFDILMFGCLAAILRSSSRFQRIKRMQKWTWCCGLFAVLAIATSAGRQLNIDLFRSIPMLMFADTIIGFGIVLGLVWLVDNPESHIGSVFNSSVLVSIGLISYSLYLWQQIFLPPAPGSAVQRMPLNILCAVGVAIASYYLLERPFIRLRIRLVGTKSPA